MSKYQYLLWDIDGTVLDFLAAEKAAIQSLFPVFGFGECSDEMVSLYSSINIRYWEALERNEITKPEVLVGRYKEFFSVLGIDTSKAEGFNKAYQMELGNTIVFCDHADQILSQLKGRYVLCAVTNGTKAAQSKKLHNSGLDKVFDHIFISEDIGVEKPNVGYFDKAFSILDLKDKSKVLIIGDSLTSDIKGGNNAGIYTCWYNPKRKKNDKGVHVDHEIHDLHEIFSVLDE